MWALAKHNTFIPGQYVMFHGFPRGHAHEALNGTKGKVQPAKQGDSFLVQTCAQTDSQTGPAQVIAVSPEHLGPWEDMRANADRAEADGRLTLVESMGNTSATTVGLAQDPALESL